jgi:biopolymer transport protein ExbB
MDAETSFGAWSLFEKGGFVMIPLFMVSIFATAVVLFKIYQFWQERVLKSDFVAPALQEMKRGEGDRAMEVLKAYRTPLSRVMQSALAVLYDESLTPEKREAEVQRVAGRELQKLESYMRGLEWSGTVSPLLGLLGTVTGMVTAFSKLESGGARVDPSVLAGGIWEALLTTVTGLTIAVPAVAAYYVLDAMIEKIRASMKDAVVQIMACEQALVYEQQPTSPAPTPYGSGPQPYQPSHGQQQAHHTGYGAQQPQSYQPQQSMGMLPHSPFAVVR